MSNIVQVDKEMLNTISQVSDLLAGDMDLYKTKLRGIDFKKIKIALDYLLNDLNLSNTQKAALIANSWRIYYRSKPPTPEEFLSEKYLGAMSDSIYPRVQKWFLEFWDESKPYRNAVLFPFIGAGKLGRNDQLIRIPTGYTTHGKIKVGEEICMPDGSISKVTHVFPQGFRNDLYEVAFSDGRNVIVGASHLWKAFKSTNNKVLDRSRERSDTIESKEPWGVYTTQNIIDDYTKNPRAKWYVPITKPVQHIKRNHILSPYFLGSLLSDENMLENLSILGLSYTSNNYREELLRLNLIEKQRDTLNIPDEYLYDSIKNRISLLQGIIDSKGKISIRNVTSYSTNNLKLSESIATLVRGLGGLAKIKKCKWAYFKKSYQYKIEIKFFTNDFPIFNSVKKQKKVNKNFMKKPYQQGIVQGISIKSILPAEPGEATCIMVDHPDHLYLANDYIVTHNSTLSVLMNLYSTVHLALMRDPKKYFGLAPSANLSYVLCSYNLTKAQETLLEPFINILDNSEFFCRVRTKENMIQSEKEYQKQREITKLFWTTASRNGVSALQFSNGLNYKLASSPSAILGLTIVMGTLTELAFFRDAGKSDAYIMKFFNAMKGRVRSRFKDKHDPTGINYWGRTILDSSPNNLESPVDNYCMFEADKTETNYVIKGSQWQWVPEDYEPEELKDTFPIYKGGNGKPPIILNSTEGYSQDEIVMVPRKLHQLFQDDLIQALKDWAGIPQGSLDKLFYDHSKIENIFVPTMKSIYFCLKADTKDSPHNLIWKQVRDDFFVKAGEGWNFYYKPGIPRVFHIDQSISGDMTAISFAHVERKYPAGKGVDLNLDRDLVYVIDMVIPIHPFGGRINLDAIKLFIEDCYIIGSLPIVHGSYDTFQSEPSLQYLDRIGIEMEHISVDETVDPYLFLAQLIEQGNLKTGRNIFLKNNLKSLRVTKRKISETLKIDHTVGDTITPSGADLTWETSLLGFNAKDCSDAVAGAVTAARQFLATDGHSLSQVWDEDTIILTPEQIRRKTLDLITQFGFSLPS